MLTGEGRGYPVKEMRKDFKVCHSYEALMVDLEKKQQKDEYSKMDTKIAQDNVFQSAKLLEM